MGAKDLVCSFDSLYRAMNVCRKGVGWKDSVTRFTNDGLRSIYRLCKSLEDGAYKIDDYYIFHISEPKPRKIVATKLKDRVFQRSLCDNYLYGAITRSFIYDNCACQIGKGTDFARERLECHLQKYYRKHGPSGYALSCDVKDYFGSTLHTTAKAAVRKLVDDDWAYEHVCAIIDSFGTKISPDRGIGLGSQVSQLVQLAVLNDLDHYVKEQLRVKHYVRYMDDFIFIHQDKEFLAHCLDIIRQEVEKLGLKLNGRKTQIFPLSQGINFLGFKFILTGSGKVVKLILKDNVKRRKRKIRKHKGLHDRGLMTKAKVSACAESWKAHAEKGDSYKVRQGIEGYIAHIWEEKHV